MKKIKNIAIAIFIALLVVILVVINPFRDGLGGKEYTGIMIKEIRTIAEWVGSEYRGEVLVSLQECEENKRRDECSQLYEQLHREEKLWQSVDTDSNVVLMRKAAQMDTSAFQKFVRQHPFADFQERFDVMFEKALADAAADDLDYLDLVYIARGRVTAGFDFTNLKRRDIELAGDTLKIYNVQSQILDVIINPWFDTEKKLKGYDLVRVSNERKVKPEHQNRVKQECLVKLEKTAREKDILTFAENAGKEYVLSLAQMLLPEQTITVVQFPGER